MKTLADEAEEWARENAREIPPRGTPAWAELYKAWVDFAFARLHDLQREMRKPRNRRKQTP